MLILKYKKVTPAFMKTLVTGMICALLILSGLSCINDDTKKLIQEEKDWEMAQKAATYDTYEAFIDHYPSSQYKQKAVEGLWHMVQKKDSISGYDSFIKKHSDSKFLNEATNRMKTLWATIVPKTPKFEINSNMSVDLTWAEQPGAQSYVVYWSPSKKIKKKVKNSLTTNVPSVNHKLRNGEYGAKLPMYYKIAAVKNGVSSKHSNACYAHLFPGNGGKFCELCGKNSIGFCHLRNVYVCSYHNDFQSDDGSNWRCP